MAGTIVAAAAFASGTPSGRAAETAPAETKATPVAAKESAAAATPAKDEPQLPPRSIATIDGKPVFPRDTPFMAGESLTYAADWMNISVGEATMTVDTNATYEGSPAIHLKAEAKSNRAFSLFFAIEDAGESWVDPKGLYSLGFISDQQEGSISDYQKWVMDYDRGVATRTRVRKKGRGPAKRSVKDYPLQATHLQDAFSMLYFFRAFDLDVGQTLVSDVFVSRKTWKLEVKIVGRDKCKVPAGTFDCLKVVPSVTLNGKPQKKGQMTIWVTDDERRIPVKIQSEIPLGKVNAELVRFKEGKDD